MQIAGRLIGESSPCFIIAEAGVNHNGDLEKAFQLVNAAVDAGADAVKFQTFKADLLVTASAPKAVYQEINTGEAGNQLEMLRKLELDEEAHYKIKAHCDEKNIIFLSTPFDDKSLEFLIQLKVAAFKVSSGDLTNMPFLQRLAAFHQPIILSTGMATLDEVKEAVKAINRREDIAILHCVSNYPADPADTNLRAILTLKSEFNLITGYSDHTLGSSVALASVAMGASIVEKHFTLDRALPGPDHKASLEPCEIKDMVREIRIVESAMGNGLKRPAANEISTAAVARKSLVFSRSIGAGSVVYSADVAIMRPGTGMSPSQLDTVVGRTLGVDVGAGELINPDMFS